MFDKLKAHKDRFLELETELSKSEVVTNQELFKTLNKEYSSLTETVQKYDEYMDNAAQIEDLKLMAEDDDAEIAAMAKEELGELTEANEALTEELKILLLPKDPNDDKNVVLEIRAGTGGEEAALFGGNLLRMYTRYAERGGFGIERLSSNVTELGGVKEMTLLISGKGAYSRLKYESGVHRVQRVPETESQGRIHTSAATVAVLPEAEDVDVHVDPNDYRVDVFRASGPGGQSVNTTDSAVRITYKPGSDEEIIVTCQDGKSQIKNKEKALNVLRARLLERERARAQAEAREARLVQIGTGDRSEKIRTYNVPQSRVTDHRIGFTTRNLAQVLAGDLGEIVDALSDADLAARMGHATHGMEASEPPLAQAGGAA